MLGNHPLGLYEKALDARDDWPTRLAKAKQLDFDFVEICIDEQDARIGRLYESREQLESFRRTCYQADLPILSMCLSAHRKYPFGSSNPQTRRKAFEIMEKAIAFASAVGIRVIQLAGYDVYYEPSTNESRASFLEGLAWATHEAARQQVTLAVEIMDTTFINSITRYLWFKERIRSPWLQVYPDIGNLTAWGNDIEGELRKGIDDIVAVHVKDTKAVTPSFGGQFKSVPWGSGNVNFAQCFGILQDLSYCGPYLLEMWHESGTDDMGAVSSAKAFIEEQFARGISEGASHK